MNNISEKICTLEHKVEHGGKTMDSSHNAPTSIVLLSVHWWRSDI